jgi:hypothetical protein
MAKLGGPMTCGYGIDASDALRSSRVAKIDDGAIWKLG